MVTREINVFVLLHRYRATFNAVNIYYDRERLIDNLKNDLNKYTSNKENLDKDLVLEYITYPNIVYQDKHVLINDIVNEYDNLDININHWLVIDGLDIVKIKDYDTMMKNYDSLYKISHDATMNRGKDLVETREKLVSDLSNPDNTGFDRAKLIAVIGNTYDLTESIIDDNKEDLSNIITSEIQDTRLRYENTKDPENEWELVNMQVEAVLRKDKELKIESCTYNGKPIEYDDIVKKLLSHVFPNYLTQINILDTLDDNYVIETDKCRIIRSIGGGLRVERKYNDEAK